MMATPNAAHVIPEGPHRIPGGLAPSKRPRRVVHISEEMRERDLRDCWISCPLLAHQSADCVLEHFTDACFAEDFLGRCTKAGFDSVSFHRNPHSLRRPNRAPCFVKFASCLPALKTSTTDNAHLGVVFHGTASENIQSILCNGLDPSKRKGQAYGPGEYFSKDPGTAVSFCQGNLEMLVFVVALPSTTYLASTAIAADTETRSCSDRRRRPVPPRFVVVEDNTHQIPIGTLKFQVLDPRVLEESELHRSRLQTLSLEVNEKHLASTKSIDMVEETKAKANIIQSLIVNHTDIASERYERFNGMLGEISKREVAWYVHKHVDPDLHNVLFSGLSEPLTALEVSKTTVLGLEEAVQKETHFKLQLEKAKAAEAVAKDVADDSTIDSAAVQLARTHHSARTRKRLATWRLATFGHGDKSRSPLGRPSLKINDRHFLLTLVRDHHITQPSKAITLYTRLVFQLLVCTLSLNEGESDSCGW